jgi:hypothetical protein
LKKSGPRPCGRSPAGRYTQNTAANAPPPPATRDGPKVFDPEAMFRKTRWRRDRSVDRCSMTRDALTAAGGCLTDRTIMPALSMPYNGGRVDSASRTFSPDEGRGAYAK